MAILFGTTSTGTTLPVLVDQYGNLLAKGMPGAEGPPGPPGGAFALPPNPVDGDVLGWENGQLVWNPTPPIPEGTYGPFTYFDNGSNLVVPQTPTLSSGELLFMSDADGNIAYYTPTTSAISSVVVTPGGWTSAAAAEDNAWSSVTYGDGKFVAVAQDGSNRVMYSTNGINWTSLAAAENNSWQSVTYGDDKFVAVAYTGSNRVMYDATGTGAGVTELGFNSPNHDLQYFAVGDVVDTSGTKVTSIDLSANKMNLDGGTWTTGETVVSSTDISGTGSVDAVVGNRIDLQANNQHWIDGYYVTVQN